MRPDDPGPRHGDPPGHGAAGPATAHFAPEATRSAFLDFFQCEYDGVIAFLMKYGAISQDAEDAAQDAFVDAWTLTMQPGAWEKVSQPRGWIRKVALRKYHRPAGRRKQVRGFPVPDLPGFHTPGSRYGPPAAGSIDHGELTVQTEFVRSILRDVAPDIRAVLVFHMDGFSSAEIAYHLHITDQQVRDLIKKGRRTLRAGLVALRDSDGRRAR